MKEGTAKLCELVWRRSWRGLARIKTLKVKTLVRSLNSRELVWQDCSEKGAAAELGLGK